MRTVPFRLELVVKMYAVRGSSRETMGAIRRSSAGRRMRVQFAPMSSESQSDELDPVTSLPTA